MSAWQPAVEVCSILDNNKRTASHIEVQRQNEERFSFPPVTLVTFAVRFTILGATHHDRKKQCERGVATRARCATIGTVQESFTHRLLRRLLPKPQDLIFRGRPAAHRYSASASGRKALCFAPRESRCHKGPKTA